MIRTVSLSLCSHSLAVAEHTNGLAKCIQLYKQHPRSGSVTGLASVGMPSSRGKKATKATSVRKGPANKTPHVALEYVEGSVLGSPKPPDEGYILYILDNCHNSVSK